MQLKPYWHYPREQFTQKIVRSIEAGLVQCLTIFAPRRIGKTQFLEFDLKPALEAIGYEVIYFSFYGDESSGVINEFLMQLRKNISKSLLTKLKINEINLSWCKINFRERSIDELNVIELITTLCQQAAKQNKKLVLMLDEIQELLNINNSRGFISSLRTALDLNKLNLNVIFTGSSQTGLRLMFDDRKAPFFHFSLNVEMELFERDFSDFIADKYIELTNKNINKDKLWEVFGRLGRITEYLRHVINQILTEPNLDMDTACQQFLTNINSKERLDGHWQRLSDIEKILCKWIALGNHTFYDGKLAQYAKLNHSQNITQGKIQYALEMLQNKYDIIQKLDPTDNYTFSNQYFATWILENI